MALVVLLRGVNVGGHRSFRPARFVEQLSHLDAVNVGSTGVFVIRRPVSRTQLRAEIATRLPFAAEIMICGGQELTGLLHHPAFAKHRAGPSDVRFVSVLSRRPRSAPRLPVTLPPQGKWLVKVIARDGRFALGIYRRHMKVIGYLGALDRIFGVAVTTRSWNTIEAIARALNA
jgi:uncharacterized protein (DUF1697 family)